MVVGQLRTQTNGLLLMVGEMEKILAGQDPCKQLLEIYPHRTSSCLPNMYKFYPKFTNCSPKCVNSLPWEEKVFLIPHQELLVRQKKSLLGSPAWKVQFFRPKKFSRHPALPRQIPQNAVLWEKITCLSFYSCTR